MYGDLIFGKTAIVRARAAALLVQERDAALARAETAEAEAARWRGIALHTAEEAARMRSVSVTHRTGA